MVTYFKQPRIEDKAYLEFIRHEQCLACKTYAGSGYIKSWNGGRIEAHHPKHTEYGGNLGWNVKADDKTAMPLCHSHHRESENMGEDRFYKKYGINPQAEAIRLQKKYEEMK